MNFKGREITVAMACRTTKAFMSREALMSRKAISVAAAIHTTTIVLLFMYLAVPLHPVFV